MKLPVVAAAVAALIMLVPATKSVHAAGYSMGQTSEVAQIDIARIKSALKLTPAQRVYWPAVEAALRDVARRQTQGQPRALVHRVTQKIVSIVLDSAAIQRLATAARPLIVALNDDQRRHARALAQEMGLGPVVGALY